MKAVTRDNGYGRDGYTVTTPQLAPHLIDLKSSDGLRFISYRAFVTLVPLGWGHLHTMLAIGSKDTVETS